LAINGAAPTLLNSAAVTAFGARYEFTNPALGSGEDRVPGHVSRLGVGKETVTITPSVKATRTSVSARRYRVLPNPTCRTRSVARFADFVSG
jgi:hypothetical protein